jgi:tetratricopeptide (TPR) repeat protein
MRKVFAALILASLFVPVSRMDAAAEPAKITKITERIMTVQLPGMGDGQIVIASEKGLVAFNTFWSAVPARAYREGIAEALGRGDFHLVVNLVDRLDFLGGNAAYEGTRIVGHENILRKYKGKEAEADEEVKRLIEMWRWKEGVSRERLAKAEPGSKEEAIEKNWSESCRQRAEELETGFSLVLPTETYGDRKTCDLGDLTLELIWFGRSGYDGMSIAVVPEEKTAIMMGFIMHDHHLAPYPNAKYVKLDVPRWIDVFEEILEGEDRVDRIVWGSNEVWSREQAMTRLDYVRRLWAAVSRAESDGKTLAQTQDELSLEKGFAFVKDMDIYRNRGEEWVLPQHRSHVRVFYLQHKKMASDIIMKGIDGPIAKAVEKARKEHGRGLYFDEATINEIGYDLMNAARYDDAVEVLSLNTEVFPELPNVWDSLAEALMKKGDRKKAADYYRKVLELDPGNENAKKMLVELGE